MLWTDRRTQTETRGDLSRMAMLSSWYAYACVWCYFSFYQYKYIINIMSLSLIILSRCAQLIQRFPFSALRLTSRKTSTWLADQVSSGLSEFDFCVCEALYSTLGTCRSRSCRRLFVRLPFTTSQIRQRCCNRCETCPPSVLHLCCTISITAASFHRGVVLTGDTAHYCRVTQFSPGLVGVGTNVC